MWWEIPGHLEIRKGELYIAGKPALQLAGKHGTPTYVYNTKRVVDVYRKFHKTVKKYTDKEVRVLYANKANANLKILEALNKEGSWIDSTSPGEVRRALDAGFPKERIKFTGTSVSNTDLKELLDMDVMITIDSISEMKRLIKLGAKRNVSIRMDPGIEGMGHHWTNVTAGKESHGSAIKFSIPENKVLEAVKLAESSSLNISGLSEHVGSGWKTDGEIDEFLRTADIVIDKAKQVTKATGRGLEAINFGGGPGVRYMESDPEFPLDRYAKEVCERVDDSGLKVDAICFEPGRYIVADSGLLLVEVVDIKDRYGDIIAGVNSGFNQLIRPVLYGSYHEIINCTKADAKPDALVTVAGNLCETGDVFTTKPRKMPMPEEGDILAIHNAGAYGYVMASNYNLRGFPKEIVL